MRLTQQDIENIQKLVRKIEENPEFLIKSPFEDRVLLGIYLPALDQSRISKDDDRSYVITDDALRTNYSRVRRNFADLLQNNKENIARVGNVFLIKLSIYFRFIERLQEMFDPLIIETKAFLEKTYAKEIAERYIPKLNPLDNIYTIMVGYNKLSVIQSLRSTEKHIINKTDGANAERLFIELWKSEVKKEMGNTN